MSRPVKLRRICAVPKVVEFKPCTTQKAAVVELTVDEYEVIRLIDYLGLSQKDCATQMNVARTTVQLIYDTARKKLADVLVCGNRLVIQGGHYAVCGNAAHCCGKNCTQAPCRGHGCVSGEANCLHCSYKNGK